MDFTFLKHLRLFWWPFIIFTTISTSLIVGENIGWNNVIMLSIALCLAASFACLHNDLVDQKCDAINKNNGNGHYICKTNKIIIIILLIVFFLLPVGVAILITPKVFIFILLLLIMMLFYNYLKYFSPLSLILSSTAAMAPIILPIIFWSNSIVLYYIPLISLLILVMGREVVADINDYKGDKEAGKKTLPIKIGRQKSYKLVLITVFLSVLFLLLHAFFISNTAGIIFCIIFSIFILWTTFTSKNWKERDNLIRYIKLTRFAMLFSPLLLFA